MNFDELQKVLKARFEEHMERHPEILWEDVEARVGENQWEVLRQMELAGGEPDVIVTEDGQFIFADCCRETPADRRSVCYDEPARLARKKHAPERSAWGMAKEIGADLMDERSYRVLQSTGEYDLKGQVWLATDEAFRKKGEALFANLRHGRVFIYYNGVQSYYKTRGFRCMLVLD